MTGAALTGRLGIIPTLGRIIRVYDPSEDKTSTAQWRKGQCGRQWAWMQSTNHTHRPQPAISGQCKSSKWEPEEASGQKFEFRPHWLIV